MFKISNNIAIPVKNVEEAEEFYSRIIGFKKKSTIPEGIEFEAAPFNIYVQKDNEIKGVVMELFVDDLESARNFLLENGCKILRWEGPGKDCYIEDPYGLRFNIWQINRP